MDVALGIGPVIFGLFITFIGYRGMYEAAAVVALACVFYIIYYTGKSYAWKGK